MVQNGCATFFFHCGCLDLCHHVVVLLHGKVKVVSPLVVPPPFTEPCFPCTPAQLFVTVTSVARKSSCRQSYGVFYFCTVGYSEHTCLPTYDLLGAIATRRCTTLFGRILCALSAPSFAQQIYAPGMILYTGYTSSLCHLYRTSELHNTTYIG